MLTIAALRDFGADVDDGMQRCMNNEAFYLRLVGMAIEDKGFENLRDAVEKADLDAAFEAAHALKGILANLSLTPLYTPTSEITELLRAKQDADYAALTETLLTKRAELKALSEG